MASLDGSLSVARARRRPARYSPELSASTTVQQQQQQSATEMCISELLANGSPESIAAATLAQRLQEQLQQEQEENGEEEQEEMAPAKRGKQKPKRRYKKRSNVNEDGSKRPRVANVLLENEMLIDEIRARKALWNRTHEQHHSSVLTAPLWEEVAKALDTTQENIRRRWKSLKDHYRRELKKAMTDATAPPSIWPYYKKMRFMKSQMFVSLRRKNGEDHLEILSDDEEEVNNQWNGQEIRSKQECGSDTMDDYELSEEYNEMVKYEQHMQQLGQHELDGTQEEEEEEEEDQQQNQQDEEEQEEQMQEQGEMSPAQSMQDQEELSALQQQQAELSELSNMSGQQQNTSTISEMVGIPTIVTTTASSLTERLSDMQQHGDLQQQAPDMNGDIGGMQNSGRISSMQQRDINGELAQQLNARHTVLQQQRAEVNGRLSAIQRNAEMSAIQQRANIAALHERAEMTAMQQRAEMQRRNGVVDNGSNVSPISGDGGISDDYHFFMSLMPHVRHFTSLQKLKVRNRIQQIIIEEASNCQYDPLENC